MSPAAGVVLVGGEALMDLVPTRGSPLPAGAISDAPVLQAHPGGGPFNTARTLGRLGVPTAFLGRLSGDRYGTLLQRMLRDDGVETGAVVHTDEPTTLALAEVDDDGGARYRFYLAGTSAPGLTEVDALAALPPRVAILHVGTLGLHLEPSAAALEAVVARLAGSSMVVLDPNVRPGVLADPGAYRARLVRVLARTDLVKLSEEDLAWLRPGDGVEDGARAMLAGGPRVAVLTRGADGALVVTAEHAVAVPAPRIAVADTIGAGDAFGGGLLAFWRMRGLGADALGDLDAVVAATRYACVVAARTCERAGASPPWRTELTDPALEGAG